MSIGHSEILPTIRLLQRFAQYDSKMQISTALTLLFIARNQDRPEGVTTSDLIKWLGLTPASASRNSYYWGDGTPEMPNAGFGLVSVVIDPADRRKRVLKLTPRGEAFVNQLGEAINGTA